VRLTFVEQQALLRLWALTAAKVLLDEAASAYASGKLANGVGVGTAYKWAGELGGFVLALEVGKFSAEGLRRIAWAIEYDLRDVFLSAAQKAAAHARDREESRLHAQNQAPPLAPAAAVEAPLADAQLEAAGRMVRPSPDTGDGCGPIRMGARWCS